MIGEDALQALRDRVNLHDVVSRFVDLKKSGANWIGRCPFHADGTPSFTVPASREKPFFHCFGCGAHGDAIDFLRKHQGLTFQQAVDELARDAGVILPASGAQKPRPVGLRAPARFQPAAAPKDGLQGLSEAALAALSEWQAALPGSPAEAYLASRRISLTTAMRMGAGFLAPDQALGLNGEGRAVARGPRLVLPHTLPGGAVVNLYGRALGDADKLTKHRHLPGPKGLLNAAALAAGDGPVVLTEGAFDALALLEAGVARPVAVFGLAGFDWRWLAGCRDLVLAMDGDEAGQSAARQLELAAAYRGLKVRRLPLEAFGSKKDAADAWAAGELRLDLLPIARRGAAAPQAEARSLPPEAPEEHLAAGWPDFTAAVARFRTFHELEALAAGWSERELYSLPWNRLGTGGGAVWALASHTWQSLEIHADRLVVVTAGGARLTYRRSADVTGQLPWS